MSPVAVQGGRFRLLAVLFVTLSLVFVAALVWRGWTSAGEMADDLRRFGWSIRVGWLAAAVALATANLFLMARVWVGLFWASGGAIGLHAGARVWIVTNLGRYIPGKLWQLTGLTVYMRQRGESGAAALSSAAVFQVVTLATGAAVALATLGGRLAPLGSGVPTGVVLLVAVLAALLHPRVVSALTRRVAAWMGEDAPLVRVRGLDILEAGGGLLVAWAAYGVGLWLLLQGLGSPRVASPVLLTGIFAASYVTGYLALVSPGGLLVREGAMAGLLAALTPIPLAVGAAVAVAARLWVTASELLALVAAGVPTGPGRDPEPVCVPGVESEEPGQGVELE
jgi:uncharacterized membrane protein YbhN (UPF0104 family)